MGFLGRVLCLLTSLFSLPLHSAEADNYSISVGYELLDEDAFHKNIVGNTVVGMTRQSKSLYMLYFALDGSCELWKQNQLFSGTWWIDKDELGRDVVHAFWPEYQSTHPKSLFSPENPRYGTPTSVMYFISTQHQKALLLATKSAKSTAIVVPERQLGGK